MICPLCGKLELIPDTRDFPYSYKDETTVIKAVTGEYCQDCDEFIVEDAEMCRVTKALDTFDKQVNTATASPSFIARVRKKLRLNQREAAEMFGVGSNAFSRYENGKLKPPLSLVKLLKLLDRYPELFDEV